MKVFKRNSDGKICHGIQSIKKENIQGFRPYAPDTEFEDAKGDFNSLGMEMTVIYLPNTNKTANYDHRITILESEKSFKERLGGVIHLPNNVQ